MKTKFIVFLAISAIVTNLDVHGFGQPLDPSHSNYVVIGAFAIQGHADIWVANAKKMNFTAISAINPNRNLYYVYVMHTGDRKAAFDEATKLRKATPWWDTWVYTGLLGVGEEGSVTGSDLHPVTGQTIDKIEAKDAPTSTSQAQDNGLVVSPAANSIVTPVATSENGSAGTVTEAPSTEAITTDEKTVVEDAEEGSKNFVFKIFTVDDKTELPGEIDVLDVDRGGRKVASYQGNQNVVLKTINKSGNLSLVCEVFGYRKIKRDINFVHPTESEGIVQDGNQTIVPFGLSRLQKGDFSVMYNVYFFKDAAIMRPESRSEVNSLLAMMKENPKYKIKIHGHTNGNAHGKVISMGESKKFFALTDTKEGFGSAKKLSEERAKVIREYLKAEGVDEKRMEIKAWGGKRPVEDKMSAQAQSNVRVEIEILEDK